MKKKFKKAVAVILTIAMTMSVGVPAFATIDSTEKITPYSWYFNQPVLAQLSATDSSGLNSTEVFYTRSSMYFVSNCTSDYKIGLMQKTDDGRWEKIPGTEMLLSGGLINETPVSDQYVTTSTIKAYVQPILSPADYSLTIYDLTANV